jgi:hypothetical protein
MDYYITEFTARLLENGGRYQAQYLIPMNPMSVIIFSSASSNLFFTEMMCKQLIFCVKAATRLAVRPAVESEGWHFGIKATTSMS